MNIFNSSLKQRSGTLTVSSIFTYVLLPNNLLPLSRTQVLVKSNSGYSSKGYNMLYITKRYIHGIGIKKQSLVKMVTEPMAKVAELFCKTI